ncbi:MAG: T9SS type A sorting domain-containing protein [Vicingaceae bacterium]
MLKKYITLIISTLLILNFVSAQTVTVYLTTSGGSFSSEKWVNITTGINGTGTQVWGQGNGTLGNGSGLLTDESITLNCGTTYFLNAYDQWGDDWDGTTYELRDAISGGGTLIINNSGNSPDGFGGFNSSTWVAGDDLETSESFTIACPCANPPAATYTVVEDCPNSQFSINVNVTALGDASDVNITNDGGVAATNNAGTGTTSIGPFAAGTNVIVTVDGTGFGGCTISSTNQSASCVVSSSQDCAGGTSICSDAVLSGNSNGPGPIDDIDGTTGGCLGINENESSWYFFEAQSGGKLEFGIKPQNGTDDYDFALWGPYPSGSTPASICPPAGAPIRCSFAAGAPNAATGTGLVTGAGDTSEDTGGDDIVDPIFPSAGDVYILLIDNYAATTSPFDMDMTLSSGLTLNCTPLPIELLNFNGYPEDGYNKLTWTTATEVNNNRFIIQKSHDGILFQYLGEIEGQANSNRNVEYNFIDENINDGILYYRLRQEDYDGSFTYSNTIAVKQSANAEIAFFPNPTKGNVKLNFVSKSNEEITITISSAFQQIHQQKIAFPRGNHIYNIDVFKELAPGFYIVNATDANGNTIKTEKIIKN